jgi:hypothetical protein
VDVGLPCAVVGLIYGAIVESGSGPIAVGLPTGAIVGCGLLLEVGLVAGASIGFVPGPLVSTGAAVGPLVPFDGGSVVSGEVGVAIGTKVGFAPATGASTAGTSVGNPSPSDGESPPSDGGLDTGEYVPFVVGPEVPISDEIEGCCVAEYGGSPSGLSGMETGV